MTTGRDSKAGRGHMVVGVVEKELPRALFRVRCDGKEILAGVPVNRRHGIVKILAGDQVEVEVSASDDSRGRILRVIR